MVTTAPGPGHLLRVPVPGRGSRSADYDAFLKETVWENNT